MDYEHYISDGNLEKVLLGFATPEEEAEYQIHLNIFPEIQTEQDEVERRLERLAFKDAALPPAHIRSTLMHQIALEADQAVAGGSWYARRDVHYEDVQPPANKMRVHIGWKLLLISLLVMIAASLLASVVFFYMTISK